jgi:hypothetical protein
VTGHRIWNISLELTFEEKHLCFLYSFGLEITGSGRFKHTQTGTMWNTLHSYDNFRLRRWENEISCFVTTAELS